MFVGFYSYSYMRLICMFLVFIVYIVVRMYVFPGMITNSTAVQYFQAKEELKKVRV